MCAIHQVWTRPGEPNNPRFPSGSETVSRSAQTCLCIQLTHSRTCHALRGHPKEADLGCHASAPRTVQICAKPNSVAELGLGH